MIPLHIFVKRAIGFRDTGPRVYLMLAQGGLR
jgi:hypothetical protein